MNYKIFLFFFLFLAFAFASIFYRGAFAKFIKNASADEKKESTFENAFRNMKRQNTIFATATVVFYVEKQEENSLKWERISENVIKRDRHNGRLYFSSYETTHDIIDTYERREYFFQNGESCWITINEQKFPANLKITDQTRRSAYKRKGGPYDDTSAFDEIFSYNTIIPDVTLWESEDKLLIKPKYTIETTKKTGVEMLKFEYSTNINNQKAKEVFLFDVQSGCLCVKERVISVKDENNKIITNTWKITPKDYFYSNGVMFPSVIEYEFEGGSKRRYIIDKEKTKINEPLAAETFIPAIPPDCEVKDEISGKIYRTPAIGNSGAEKEIVNELEKLYEKAQK